MLCALLAVALPGAALVVTGCGGKKDQSQIIGRLLNAPTEFANRDLDIVGKVVNTFDPTGGLLGLAAYQVEDGSGKIWVVSRAGAPSIGQEIRLKARLRRDPLPIAISLPGVSVTLLDELERQRR
ncbi:MAG: hypothetical protein H7145_14415 [Akkermansiaceae bacterium]|nr:hypothetical protein [Armatimonadota bacterium]